MLKSKTLRILYVLVYTLVFSHRQTKIKVPRGFKQEKILHFNLHWM